MIEIIQQYYAPIMFFGLILFLFTGFPVAFSLGACGLFFGIIGVEFGLLSFNNLQALTDRIFGIMQNETLLAIPFFTFMGLILERSGMAEDLLKTIGQVFGPVRGGLAYAVIFVGAMLAATTGVVAASVISMGLISLPIMLRHGYDRRLASGVIAASGTLAQIIPPSLVLIVIADQMGRSVGDLYNGAFLPGFILTCLYALWVFLVSMFRPSYAPALTLQDRGISDGATSSGMRSLGVLTLISTILAIIWGLLFGGDKLQGHELVLMDMGIGIVFAFIIALANKFLKLHLLSDLAERVTFVLIPPLMLIFLVLGTIFLGIATPTEGGAMGAVGAVILATMRRRLPIKRLKEAMESTAKLSCFVVFILIGATAFSMVFQFVDGRNWVQSLFSNLPGGEIGFLIVANLMVFFLAFFLDFFELAFIVVPLLVPVAEHYGIDLIWFGVMLAVNMQTSFMHPPFGFALFYLRSVAPAKEYTDRVTGKRMAPVTIGDIYRGAIPFVVIQIIMVILVIAFPNLVQHQKSAVMDDKSAAAALEQMLHNKGNGNNYGAADGQNTGGVKNNSTNIWDKPATNTNPFLTPVPSDQSEKPVINK
ncbi:MAG: TRAP transporter large permease subunit [Alphaproteobacteria bacterium]|nr:TRAP transporter large permease subunit [Alphaproteobacteria bacterium]